jgi:hypothetical protein
MPDQRSSRDQSEDRHGSKAGPASRIGRRAAPQYAMSDGCTLSGPRQSGGLAAVVAPAAAVTGAAGAVRHHGVTSPDDPVGTAIENRCPDGLVAVVGDPDQTTTICFKVDMQTQHSAPTTTERLASTYHTLASPVNPFTHWNETSRGGVTVSW